MMCIKRSYFKKTIAASAFLLMTGMLAAQTTPPPVNKLFNTTGKKGVAISGTITDAITGKGMAGATVEVKDFSAVITDDKGAFTLLVPSTKATVTITGAEGYEKRFVALKGNTQLNVALLDDEHESFHETASESFGLKEKIHTTLAVQQYNVNSAWAQPMDLADGILQGRVTGLNAIRRSGTPGAGANLFLRGYNSLYATNKPLVIVDNMLFDVNDYGESIIANNYTNPLALIDIKDIENITVLKDAASIYGTKGANGAIIITTSRAKSQATKIDFSIYSGFNFTPKNLPVMNASDYRTYLSEMLQSKGMTPQEIAAQPYMNDDPENPAFFTYHNNTDWQKKIFSPSMNQNYFLKVTGGDNIATYGLSVGVTNNKGIVDKTDFIRYNTRFNAEFNFSQKFTGAANLSFTYNEQNLKDQGIADKTAPVYLSLVKSPFLTDYNVNENGIVSPNLSERDTLGISNPAVIIQNMQAYNKYYRFAGSFTFKYDISKNLKASSLIGVVFDKVRENFFVPKAGVEEDTLYNAIAQSRMGTQVKRLFSVYNDTRLEYTRAMNGIHNIASRLGFRYQLNEAQQDFAFGFNSATDDLVSVQNGLNALRQVGGGIGEWSWMNAYFNADYDFRKKLFFSFNVAMDGSSRFGKEASDGIELNNHKFAVLPSIGAAWLLSSEEFMANSSINLLKLRTTYSISGNDDIGNYSSRRTYVSQNLLGAQGLVRSGVANPALQWETVRKLNTGIDVAFWNERVNLGVDAFYATTSNMLVYYPINTITGFTNVLTNSGKMDNKGLEASLNVRVINARKVRWDVGVNIGTYKNRVLAVPGNSFTTEYAGATILTQEGKAANLFYGYTTNGVFVSDAEAAASELKKKNTDGSYTSFSGGDIRFSDLDGNKVIDENDRQVLGSSNPDFTGGFTNRILWNRFEFNALFTFTQGNEIFNYLRSRLESASGVENQFLSVNNRWRGNGHETNVPKATYNDPMGNSRFSNRWIEDGSYFRLRTLSVQYLIPGKQGSFLKSTVVYATANNLFTLTRYKGYDPEFSVTPSLFSQGIDTGMDPLFKSVTLGVKIGL